MNELGGVNHEFPEDVHRNEMKKKTFTSVQGYTLHEILGKGSFG